MKRYANLTLVQTGLVLILALPWLSPFAPGPSPAVVPLLVSLACLALVCGVASGSKTVQSRALLSPYVIALSLSCAALVSCMLGILQYLGWSPHLGPWVNQAGAGEAFANLRQRNQFASLVNIGFVCVMWLGRTTQPPHRVQALLLYVTVIFFGVGNAASASRTGLRQLVVLTLVYGCRCVAVRRDLSWRLVLVAWLAYGLTAWGLPALTDIAGGILSRGGDGSSCAGRRVLWANVMQLIGQKPWFGWGWGELDYAHYMTLYPGARFCDILDNAHNLPLHLAVELGIPFALAVCGAATWIVWRARPWCETDPTRQMAWGVLAVIMLHSMLEYPLWYGPFQMAFGLSVWMLWPRPSGLAVGPRPYAHTGAAIRLVIATALLAAVAYAGWDYHRVSQVYLAPQARDAAYRDDTMNKVRDSWLFRNQVRFAELTTTPLTRDNAQWTFDIATALLHFSPEPRVIEKVIESAFMLGREDEALAHRARYRAAFPQDHEKWAKAQGARMGRMP